MFEFKTFYFTKYPEDKYLNQLHDEGFEIFAITKVAYNPSENNQYAVTCKLKKQS